jgi:hypothetical protein
MEWQPIETAPRDGDAILAIWCNKDGKDCGGHMVVWFWCNEWTCVDNPQTKFVEPSFWMPLPAPPA